MPKYDRIKKIYNLALLGNNLHSKQEDGIQNSNFRLPSKCKEYEEIPIGQRQPDLKSDDRSTNITYTETKNTKMEPTGIIENGNCLFKNDMDDLPLVNKKHNENAILPVEQSTDILNIQSEKHRLYEEEDMSTTVPNLENIFEIQNWHMVEITEDKNDLPPPHLQHDFAEMRNVTPTKITKENFNCHHKNNNDYLPPAKEKCNKDTIPPVEEHNHFSLQLEENIFIEDEEISEAATYFENIPQNPNCQPDELTEDEINVPPPAKKKHNENAILPVEQSTETLNIQSEKHRLYDEEATSTAVPNLENIFEIQNWHMVEITEEKNDLPPPHLQHDFAEMRNVTPTKIPNENFKFNLTKNEKTQNPNCQPDELTEYEINVSPPAKKKRIKNTEDRLKLSKEKHPMGAACQDKCIRKCTVNITEEQRQTIWDSYWNMDVQRRRDFISRNVENRKIAIRYSNSTKRNHTYTYKLLNHRVCKTMFLRTLGYTNDQAVLAVLKANFKISKTQVSAKVSAAPDLRGRHKPKHSFSDEYLKEIDDFIELFHPASSHYTLEHAPNRRYLPTGLTLSQMFIFLKHHLERKNKQPCSWSAFHKRIKMKNISTQQPVQDKCPKCEAHDVAHPKPKLPRDERVTDHSCHECNCEVCIQFPQHLDNKNISRAHMNADSKDAEKEDSGIAIFTVDMQKCITMPQLNNKDFFFSRKLNLFNETFAGIGKGNKPATAMLWHEGESGRKAFDIATAYILFIKTYCRDYKTVILYADNCNAQNKNKILYSALLRLINDCCNDIKTIKIEYLEPGHTYMSADSVHGAITNKMNKSENLYDFDDYVHTINNSRKNLISHVHDHKEVMLFKSELKSVFPRNYNISSFKIVEFRRGKPKLFVKNDYQANDFKELDILSKTFKKEIMKTVGKEVDMFINVARRTEAEGISKKKEG